MVQPEIMIVDDNPSNLKLLEDILLRQGYGVRSFPLGRLALASAMRDGPPSLILLDINMPEMSGYEVCEQLNADPRLADIPVIFLSALNETQDKVKAFRAGGVDYISKPFQFEEVQARVETHLKLHGLQQELKLHNERLEATVAERTRELAESNARLTLLDRAKNEFLSLISHEFRTPLNGLLGISELILADMAPTRENIELQQMLESSRQRILSILDDALLLTQIDVSKEEFEAASLALSEVLSRSIEATREFAQSRGVSIAPVEVVPDIVQGNEALLIKVLHDLLETAVKFSVEGSVIRVARELKPGSLKVLIEGNGKSVPVSAIPKFFDVFSMGETSTPAGDLGLGPSVAYRILRLFGASVKVENLDPPGIRLTVSFRPGGVNREYR
jgi:two-component system, sensor histidine kinase and response regulator